MPLSEGISPVQGADRHGPTAVVKSAAKMDHIKTGGTLLNMKFTPALLADENGIDKLAHLVRGYFKMDGHHVQFNVVSRRHAPQGPGRSRSASRLDRPRGRLQRLLLRPLPRTAGRDHRPHRTRRILKWSLTILRRYIKHFDRACPGRMTTGQERTEHAGF